MYKDLIKIPTANMPREVWLEERRKSIGGSDAASILGLNKFSSPYSVWADKKGLLPEKEDSESMRLGRDLEDYVAKRFTERTGKKVRRENYMIRNPRYPYAHADVDRMVIGEDAGLECKTTKTLTYKKFKNGEYPAYYYCQCVHYMMVTGCKRWYLGVLVLGEGFYEFTIERDEEEIQALAQSEEAFWEYVERNNPPAPDGSKASSEAVSNVFSEVTDESVVLYGRDGLIAEYMELGEKISELENMRDEISNKLKSELGQAQYGESNSYKVSWKMQSRTTYDTKRLFAEHPELDAAKYQKQSQYRTFKVGRIA